MGARTLPRLVSTVTYKPLDEVGNDSLVNPFVQGLPGDTLVAVKEDQWVEVAVGPGTAEVDTTVNLDADQAAAERLLAQYQADAGSKRIVTA